jgi:hypothetical protein
MAVLSYVLFAVSSSTPSGAVDAPFWLMPPTDQVVVKKSQS